MKNRIEALRSQFVEYKVSGYIVPSYDEYRNEYPPEHNKRLKWISGFSGSNGFAIITNKYNFLLTDGRYLEQASVECGEDFYILDIRNVKLLSGYLDDIDISVGYPSSIITSETIKFLKRNVRINFVSLKEELIDKLWQREIFYNTKKPRILDAKYTAEAQISKLNRVFDYIQADYLLITDPCSVCWLLNIRGQDLPYTPVVMSYCLLRSSDRSVKLFSHLSSIKDTGIKIELLPMENFEYEMQSLDSNNYLQIDPASAPIWIEESVQIKILKKEDPCALFRSIKNKVEIAGIEYAHIQDGVALTNLFYWLDEHVNHGISEKDVDMKLLEFKKGRKLFSTKSFDTISASGGNSSIIHYNYHTNNSTKYLSKNDIFLLDSGSQYICGTTDVTRTIHFETPTDEQKLNFTLVLKGLIKLSNLKFPNTTTGSQLDSIARQFLWKEGLDYPHATGHGVGCFLSVHEGPYSLSKRSDRILQENVVLSIEPGIYKPEMYGIRIENLVVIQKSQCENFLEFRTLTKAHIDHKLILEDILDYEDKIWLLNYHVELEKALKPYLKHDVQEYLSKYVNYYKKII